MILHGIESPNIAKANTLTKDIRGLEEKDRFDCILANPPFGGKENDSIQQNFPIKTNATEMLFLQHIYKHLKKEWKAADIAQIRDKGRDNKRPGDEGSILFGKQAVGRKNWS